jgi:hypothetical protein
MMVNIEFVLYNILWHEVVRSELREGQESIFDMTCFVPKRHVFYLLLKPMIK